MSNQIHTFAIEWEDYGLVQFASTDIDSLEVEVSQYLKADGDFGCFIKALSKDSDLAEEDKMFLKGLMCEEHTISIADLDRVSDIDVDDIKFQMGKIRGWLHAVHPCKTNGQVQFPGGMNQFKARAKRFQSVLKKRGHDLTNAECLEILSDSLFSKPFNESSNNLI